MTEKQWGQIVAKAWQDEAFKKRLLAEPASVLKELGVAVPADMTVKVIENTPKTCYLTLPVKPSTDQLSAEDLERVAGGLLHRIAEDPCMGGELRRR